MAGIEVVGVILGSIPLVIGGLERYGKGLAIMQGMKVYEYDLEDMRAQFGVSMGVYTDSCHSLIHALSLTDPEENELLVQHSNAAWANELFQSALKGRLGPNYEAYLKLNKMLNERIEKLCKWLGITRDTSIVTSDDIKDKSRMNYRRLLRRVKGGLNMPKYQDLLSNIDRDIDKLERLTSSSIRLEPLRAEKRRRSQSMYWPNVQEQARRLFESLNSRFFPCSCSHLHQANLRLEHRQGLHAEEAARFALLLTFESTNCDARSSPWKWKDIEFEAINGDPTQTVKPISPSPTPTKKRAQFEPSITVSQAPALNVPSEPHLSSPAARVDNLCRTILEGPVSGSCLGVLEDQPWQYNVYHVLGPGSKGQVLEAVSLKDAMSGNRSLSTKQKCSLALAMASSVLQLNGTPWLPRKWDTRDILILKDHSGDFLPAAYVSRTFAPDQDTAAHVRRNIYTRNEQVFALGVALIELAYGSPLLSFIIAEDLDECGEVIPSTELSIANRLADRIGTREPENYANAVLRCIWCSFDTAKSDFDDSQFREKFFDGVVTPLQANWDYANGTGI